MDALNIVMVISVILFARFGIRLLYQYNKSKKEDSNKNESND
jgi:hypothetical protein